MGCEHVIFQDLNADVLKLITASNIEFNDLLVESVTLLAGDWGCPQLLQNILQKKKNDEKNKLKRKKHVELKEKITLIEEKENDKFHYILSSGII